jgi:hypothetical protein
MESVLVKTKQLNKYLFPKNQCFHFYNHYKRNNPAVQNNVLGKRNITVSAPVCNCANWHINPELNSGQVLPKIN